MGYVDESWDSFSHDWPVPTVGAIMQSTVEVVRSSEGGRIAGKMHMAPCPLLIVLNVVNEYGEECPRKDRRPVQSTIKSLYGWQTIVGGK